MIGNPISLPVASSSGIGPTSIIWCTAGVSGIVAPAIAAEARTPDPARDHDVLRAHATLIGDNRLHAPVFHFDTEDLDPGHGLQRAELHRALTEDRARAERVDHRHTRCVEAAEHDVGVDERDELGDLGRA